jgi:diguanylate cyclase
VPDQLSFAGGLRHWWQQSDHYDWFADYLQARGLQKVARMVTATAAAGLGAVSTAVMVSDHGPTGLLPAILGWVSIALMLACAIVRFTVWPTKRQSVILLLTLNLAIAVFCQVQANALIGLVGATAFALTGVSIACFHSAKYMLYNVVVAAYIGAVQSLRQLDNGDHALIVAALGLVLIVNVSVPFGVQSLVHALGGDVVQSDRDPLTGLLHRRALFHQIEALLLSHRNHARFLAVTMLDLDGFKALNDTYGHSAGDDALIAVGEALVAAGKGQALVGRVGGDEFMVAELADSREDSGLSEQIRRVIAALPFDVTASLGTAVGAIDSVPSEHFHELVVTMTRLSDIAMYEAKRSGGNRVRHTVIDFAESRT